MRRPSGHREARNDQHGMRLAIEEAQAAAVAGDVPVGAVLMRLGEVLSRGRNRMKGLSDPRRHAEIDCLDAALDRGLRGISAFEECTLYVTVEPCAMCAGAIVLARVPRVVFGAWDEKAGMAGSIHDLLRHPKLNHSAEVVGGVLAEECGAMMTEFFKERR
ncbi:MAG: tRNA adenosine(34) deaminase TadA [Terriglobales bacterium]